MVVVPIEHGLVLAAPMEGYVRSPGLHASDLYGSLYRDLEPAKYDKRDAQGVKIPMDGAKVEMGTSFEAILEPVLAARLFGSRPGEFIAPHDATCPDQRDLAEGEVCKCGAGTIYSPDWLFDDFVLGEIKCTYYSTKGAPNDPKFAIWICQIMLYLHWLGLTQCRLIVMFVCGDYKPPSPVLKAWLLTFSEQELRENYNELIAHGLKKGLL